MYRIRSQGCKFGRRRRRRGRAGIAPGNKGRYEVAGESDITDIVFPHPRPFSRREGVLAGFKPAVYEATGLQPVVIHYTGYSLIGSGRPGLSAPSARALS